MHSCHRPTSSLAVLATLVAVAACQRGPDEPLQAPATTPAPPTPATREVPAAPLRDAVPEGVLRAYVWECDDGTVLGMSNLFREDAITLELHDGGHKLPHVRSASGARYADDTLSFWIKGGAAVLERAGQPPLNCREARAKSLVADARARGVDYRGQGNEPGWTVEIGPGASLLFIANYGQERHEFSGVTSTTGADGRLVYDGVRDGNAIRVTLRREACMDDMSGAEFDYRFVIEFGGRELRGCGTALR